MGSPFPGMDPFIEGQRWRDFHTTFVTVIREMLTPQVRPRYVVDVEEYDYALDYRRPVEPPLEPSAADWVRSIVQR